MTTATPVALPPGLSNLLSSLKAIPAERRTERQAALYAELIELSGDTTETPSRATRPSAGTATVRGLTRLGEERLDRTTSPPGTTCWLCGR